MVQEVCDVWHAAFGMVTCDNFIIYHIFLSSQGASLSGVRMQRANLEGASLMACNFEDPTGVKSANLEG